MEDPDFLKLTCPAKLSNLPALLQLVESACHRIQASPMQCHDLLLVAEEACVNVIRHAYSPNAQGEMTLRVTTETQGARHVRLTIEDAGKPFNPLSQTPPDPLAPVEDREIGGLGIMLIRQLSDRLAYRRDPQLGNIFEIEKTLLDGPAASGQAQTD